MLTAFIIVGSIILVFVILVLVAKQKMKNLPMVDDHKKIVNLSDQNFAQKTKGKVVLVDFWAAWCMPCRAMAPVLNNVAEELNGNAQVAKVNIEQYQDLARKFKVRSIPTLLILKNGVEIKRFTGMKSKDFLLNQINSIPR